MVDVGSKLSDNVYGNDESHGGKECSDVYFFTQ